MSGVLICQAMCTAGAMADCAQKVSKHLEAEPRKSGYDSPGGKTVGRNVKAGAGERGVGDGMGVCAKMECLHGG